ncbi:MAG: GntR family transcriptional regulator [Hyphomicrobiaceae bacterium]
MLLGQLDSRPPLIDEVHDRLLGAIVDGTLAPGRRLTQEELAEMLGVSRQPVSHAIHLLRRRGLFVDAGKRGIAVAPIDAARLLDLYQVREALDGLAAELAAARFMTGLNTNEDGKALSRLVEEGQAMVAAASVGRLVDADVAFHDAVHGLSGNMAITETVSDQWPHFRRSMRFVLAREGMKRRVWREHREICEAVLAGDAGRAGRLAREHTARAGQETADFIAGREVAQVDQQDK